MKSKILISIIIIVATVSLMVGGTMAYFSDTETSIGNVLTAGTLDLTIDGGNTNVIKFNVDKIRPDDQPTGSYLLKNVGNTPGYLDLEKVVVTDFENDITEPEAEAGDITAAGELSSIVNLRLYNDVDKDGYFSTGDVMLYNGPISGLAAIDSNIAVAAGATIKLNVVIDWWAHNNDEITDNRAQGDSCTFDLTFELAQSTAQ